MVFEGERPLTGSLDASLRLESSGQDVNALMQGLNGEAAFSASNGSFNGVDLIQTLATPMAASLARSSTPCRGRQATII